jgi:hypothetical protein
MVYVRGLLAGIAAVVLAVPVVAVGSVIAIVAFHRPPQGGSGAVSWDSRSLIGVWPFNWTFWFTIAFIFILGFAWEFRRASRSQKPN